MSPTSARQDNLSNRLRAQFGMLITQFLLGMAVAVIGDPKDLTSSFAKLADRTFLLLHVLVAIGLVVNAILINRLARQAGGQAVALAGAGAAAIGAAFICGVATVSAPLGGLWSYLMAAAFLAAFVFYGKLYMQAKITLHAPPHL